MFKFIFALILCSTISSAALAADYSLQDKAILGRYVLNPVNKLSSIQSAEIRFDADNALHLFVSHTAGVYALEKIDKDGVIVGGEAEEACEECEPGAEGEGDVTTVRLVKGNQGRPRLIIEQTWADTVDENGKNGETFTYILDWAMTIPNAVSFYQNSDNPAAMQSVIEACNAVVAPALNDDGPITSESEVCPSVTTVKYRTTIEESFPYYLKENTARRGTTEISLTTAWTALAKEEAYFAALPPAGLKVKREKIAAAFRKVANYLQKNTDRVYTREADGQTTYYLINTKERLISTFSLSPR